jgi:hypothetical protein
MLWDVEAGMRVMEFNDHTGDVMRYISKTTLLPIITIKPLTPSLSAWLSVPVRTYSFPVHATLPLNFGISVVAKPYRPSSDMSLISTPSRES